MIAAAFALLCLQSPGQAAPAAPKVPPPSRSALIADAVKQLVAIQEGGEWP